MSFDTLYYPLFLAIVYFLHRIVPASKRWIVLLCASVFFYACWNVPMTLLLLSVVAVSYTGALWISRSVNEKTKKRIFIAGILVCLALLGYFKYSGLIAGSLEALLRFFDPELHWQLWDVLLPVGLSFYIFQALSYIIDVYRGKMEAVQHPGYYALYISFFPQLVAGPIERASDLVPQLSQGRLAEKHEIQKGFRLLLSGYFRKIVIADLCALVVDYVFAQSLPDGFAVVLGLVCFSFQIYNDFAGYSEIAAGSGALLGIRLMRNFDAPYTSRSLQEFWRRWHISLNRWFTDYVYIPLGGSRRGLRRQILALLTVFVLSGLWHGADWSFAVWGILHGVLLSCEILLDHRRKKHILPGAVRGFVVFMTVTFLWVFFRSSSLQQAFTLIRCLFTPWHPAAVLSDCGLGTSGLALLCIVCLIQPYLRCFAWDQEYKPVDMAWVYLVLCIALGWVLRFQSGAESAFIYFQF